MNQEKDLVVSLPVQISELAQGLIFAVMCSLSFFVPFGLGHPQWLVGTVVNACLFLGALYLPKRYFVPLAVLPSLGVLSRGLIFGPLTYFLVYFLPFIWLGNLVLILVFSRFVRRGFLLSAGCAAIGKFAILFLMASIYFKFSIVPALFLQSMGFNQLATALAGGLISFLIFKIYVGSKRAN